ncbi:MAG: tetratricopeptide repeat protein [Acidobacteriota bacterium]|nr:tetratricopeptide repeat protein [Acidobacteriota bacterium]
MRAVFRTTLLIAGLSHFVTAQAQSLTPAEVNNLGASAYSAGDIAQAERHLLAALASEQLHPDPLTRAAICFNLAAVNRSRARYAQAEALYREALQLREAALGPDHASLAGPRRGLALCLLARGKAREAEQLARLAASMPNSAYNAAAALNDLANILTAASAFVEAEEPALKARRILENASATNTVAYAEVLTTLSVIFRNREQFTLSQSVSAQAASLLEHLLGPAHPSTAAAWNNLAQALAVAGKPQEAQPLLERAVATWEHAYGPDHPDVASGIANLAGVYQSLKRYKDAERLFTRALRIDEKYFGPDSPKIALDLNNLASLAVSRHRDRDAAPLFGRALAINQSAFGPEHLDTGIIAGNLAFVYYKQKRYSEAEPLFERAARIRERSFGPEDAQLARLLDGYARVLRLNRNFSDAARVEVRATGIRVRNALHAGNQDL